MSSGNQVADVTPQGRLSISIQGIRKLIFITLTVSVIAFTAGVALLVQRIFENFGPAVQQDLDWKAVRGAQELARACDLGLAVSDEAIVRQGFGDYQKVEDVTAIVALDAEGKTVAIHRIPPEEPTALFQGPPGTVRRTPGYIVAWANAMVEGSAVGRVAVVISTRRLVESAALLKRVSYGTAGAGLLALVVGILFANYFTRAIVKRDAQLAAYASGLEKKVAERTAELDRRNQGMRLVLDNVAQGFISLDMNGVMASERSRIVDKWFGEAAESTKFADYIRKWDTPTAEWFELSLAAFNDEVLPRDLLLDQMPKRMSTGKQTWSMAYTPILSRTDDRIERILLVLSDITEDLVRERMERDSREMMAIFQRVTSDRSGAEQFFEEAHALVKQISAGDSPREIEARVIHTLKGNCTLFGIESMAQMCHDLESALVAESRGVKPEERKRIRDHWAHISGLTKTIMGERHSTIELEEVDLQKLVKAIRARASHEELVTIAESWRHEPVGLRFARLAEKAGYLARRLNKPELAVHTETSGIRLDVNRWAVFWSALIHAVNNAVDHGIEDPETRLAQGKPAAGTLWMVASREGSEMVISLRDDGKGIDWKRLAQKGAERGLPNQTKAELIEVMCSDGVSTKDNVTGTSGRGVGLAALRDATISLGGRLEVESEEGKGTTFLFRFRGQSRPACA